VFGKSLLGLCLFWSSPLSAHGGTGDRNEQGRGGTELLFVHLLISETYRWSVSDVGNVQPMKSSQHASTRRQGHSRGNVRSQGLDRPSAIFEAIEHDLHRLLDFSQVGCKLFIECVMALTKAEADEGLQQTYQLLQWVAMSSWSCDRTGSLNHQVQVLNSVGKNSMHAELRGEFDCCWVDVGASLLRFIENVVVDGVIDQEKETRE
jgi:hypothetical protein